MMKASDVRPGDVFLYNNGRVQYTVMDVHDDGERVIAHVLYDDGGDGYRKWDRNRPVPLKHSMD